MALRSGNAQADRGAATRRTDVAERSSGIVADLKMQIATTTGVRNEPHDRAVSVVIPAYNNKELLAKNLPPLLAEIRARNVGDEIIVVDDAGQDGLEEFLAEDFPVVVSLRNRNNLGFGETCNAGIARATIHLFSS
jgi:cellulose synthase/poly-beta-1,6-N-acetylglucosamine synthase-like glycosyltransferase